MIDYIAYGLAALMILLIMYVILFRVYYHSEENRPWWLWPFAAVFLVLDVALNQTVMVVLCLDLPRRWTITARMKRYKKLEPDTALNWYRHYFADSLCKILNVFDKEGHC